MERINLLDENTSNKIAAGEVVEKPSSVVKELIENSIDASSKNITIEIENGGISLIRIIDDGVGIYKDDIKKAFLPHATSKIKNEKDLFSLHTLGFRGEALPSIAAVSKVYMKSKTLDQEYGMKLKIDGGVFKDITECGCNNGTTIEVRDIFYNVPARKKFLKSTSREAANISDIINRIAIANPKISFKFFNNGKKMLHTFGTGNLKDVIRAVYGKNISENILYFENADDTITLYGYVGKEEIARGSRNNQSIFVNGRYIKHKTLTVAVENAFKSFSTVNKFPFFVLCIEIYPELVDVNIHPTKAEIKFEDDRIVFKKVFASVHEALKKDVFESFQLPEENENLRKDIEEITLPIDLSSSSIQNNTLNEINKNANTYESANTWQLEKDDTFNKIKPDNINEGKINKTIAINNTTDNSKYIVSSEEIPISNAKFPEIRIIGQFNKTYILGEYEEELYIIDQHAAHEKILFEKYLNDIENSSILVQPLLVPILLELTLDDYSYYEENKQIFTNAGFTLEEFGENTLALKEVPYFLGKTETKELFLSILDNLKSLGTGKTTEVKYNNIATMACKAAVKGNDRLSMEEMESLVEKLRFINDPFHCPHGRPTIIKMTNYEMEKKFKRIV